MTQFIFFLVGIRRRSADLKCCQLCQRYHIDRCCKATEKRISGLSEALLPVVHEYVLYSEMLMAVMKKKRPDTGRSFDVQKGRY